MAQRDKADRFQDKAVDWDSRPVPLRISEGVGAALRERVSLSDDMHVMDFGAGTGLVAAHVAPYVGALHAVDVSAAMLEQLARKPELDGRVKIHCQDILRRPLDERFHLIVSAMALHHVQDTSSLLHAFAQHLRSGGRLALADLDAEDGSFHPERTEGVFHAGFDRAELGRLLAETGFVDVNFTTVVVVQKEEKSYPVFLVTATKP